MDAQPVGQDWKSDFAIPTIPDDPKREDLDAGDDVLRVVRGGSWGGVRDYARCAYRGRVLPDDRHDDIGFRVVLRSAPIPQL